MGRGSRSREFPMHHFSRIDAMSTETDNPPTVHNVRVLRLRYGALVLLILGVANLYHYGGAMLPPMQAHTNVPPALRTLNWAPWNDTTAVAGVKESDHDIDCASMSDQHRDAKFINRHVCYTREQQLQVIRTLVFEMAELLTRHNVTYFLEAGTLLGSFRNKGIIPHDTDADFGMDEPGYEYIRDHVLDDLPVGLFLEVWNSTFHPSDRDDKLPVRLIHKHSALYLDVFVFLDWTKDGKDVVGPLASWCYFNCASCPKVETGGKELRVPREWIYPLVDCELEGRTMKCPHKTEDYLRYVFGGGFMTPQQYH